MARILAISSQVAYGRVGLSIIVPALQALGHEVIALPSVILSNHPGHPRSGGFAVDPAELRAMSDALDANGWFGDIDGILTGYLPTTAHVGFAAETVNRVRAKNRLQSLTYLCDPIIGDTPKGLYIDPQAAAAIRDRLLPLADAITPNQFELGWLTGASLDGAAEPERWFAHIDSPITVATSMPDPEPGFLRNVAWQRGTSSMTRVRERAGAPHGTGDLFAAYILAALITGESLPSALGLATSGVDQVLAESTGLDALTLSALPSSLRALPAWPVDQQRSDNDAGANS